MPRRDGQPTAEEIARAQQRGRGAPPPPPPGSGPPPEAVATAALAATAGAVASAGVVAGTVAAEAAAAAAIADASAGILAAFDRFLTFRITEQQDEIEELLAKEASALSAEERLAIVAEELQRLRAFTAKARDRLAEDLPQALRMRDKADREEAVKALLERERRYVRQQEEASHGRVLGHAHASAVRKASPEGAYWRKRANCCERCDVMGGKVWPWSVLDIYRPPLHPHCEENCALWTIAEAGRMGWITEADYRARDDMPGGDIMEAVAEAFDVDPDDLEDALALIEARYDRRYPKGTAQGGKFRPRRGGVVTPAMGRARRRRGLPDAPEVMSSPVKVTPAGDRLDVRDLKVADLKVGDRLLFDGEFQEVVEVKRPGVVELSEDGLVFIDRETVRGVPAKRTPDPAPPAPPPPAGGPAYDDIIALTRGKRPSEATELLAGIHFDPDLKRSEARDGDLYLPPGFYGLTRANREAVVFRHLGRQLAEGLGDKGIADLAEQDPHLRSRKAVVDTYYAINSPARERMAELHPDAARLVATAAQEKGLPLHSEAAALIGRAPATEAPAEQHPAHRLAERIRGMGETPAFSLLMEAGYNSTEAEDEDGSVVWRSHEHGATMRLGESAHASVDTADQALAQGLAGKAWTSTLEDLRAQGFALETNTDRWYELVHPDGRAVALRGQGPWEGMTVAQARAFTPEPAEVARARSVGWGRDPLGTIKAGDDAEAVAQALRRAGWSGLRKKGGVVDYSRGYGDEREELRVRYGDGGTVVAEIGRPGVEYGSIVSDEDYQRRRAEERESRERAERERQARAEAEKAKEAEGFQGVLDALAAGKKPPLEGLPMTATVRRLRDEHGWQVVTARRRGYRQGGGVVYTLRSTSGDTLTFNGSHTVEKVTKFAPAPKITRQRVIGRPPRDLAEFNGDALGRVDELAERFEGVGAISTILYGNKRNHAAHREWNGTMVMGREVKPSIERYLAKRNAGETTTDEERLDFYSALQTVQHEINHGVTAPGAERNLSSLTPADYQGPGKGWEESLTEESAHLLAVDWLRSYEMTEVLEAVKRHPSDRRVQGVYRSYRESLRSILDEAGVPQDERADLIVQMKFRMTPKQRLTMMGERLQARGHVRRDLRTGENMTPDREAYYRMTSLQREDRRLWGTGWEPVVRPDLSDVRSGPDLTEGSTATLKSGQTVTIDSVSPTEVVATTESGRTRSFNPTDFYDEQRDGPFSQPLSDGRRVLPGYRVWVQPEETPGRVVEVTADGGMVKVETEDGMVLWYAVGGLA